MSEHWRAGGAEHRTLGTTGIEVTALTVGTSKLGRRDTITEERIGHALARLGGLPAESPPPRRRPTRARAPARPGTEHVRQGDGAERLGRDPYRATQRGSRRVYRRSGRTGGDDGAPIPELLPEKLGEELRRSARPRASSSAPTGADRPRHRSTWNHPRRPHEQRPLNH